MLLTLCPGRPAQAQAQAKTQVQTLARCPGYYLSPQERMGINVAREGGKEITDYAVTQLGAGWYLDYTWHDLPAQPATSAPPGKMVYLPVVRPGRFARATATGRLQTELTAQLRRAIRNNPGATWQIGNEPDNQAQDNQTPTAYATFYHAAYQVIKTLDPSAQVAMAPVTQVTPLRLRYLDAILDEYQRRFGTALPVDVWTVHVYLLPERTEEDDAAGGIGVPPGLTAHADEALLFTQDQHDNLNLFADQLVQMRAWLAARGYRDNPLYLTEYGILLSPYHGFDTARVQAFLLGSTAWLQGARNGMTGLPADDNRLVQRWAWFSLNFYTFDPTATSKEGLSGLNGNLFDHGSGAITPLGEAFAAFGQRLHERTVDLAVALEAPEIIDTIDRADTVDTVDTADTIDRADRAAQGVTITVVNRGDAPAHGLRVQLWTGTTLLGTYPLEQTLLPHCGNRVTIPLQWQGMATAAPPQLRLQVLPIAGQVEYDRGDNAISWAP